MTDARAFWITSPGVGEVRVESLPRPRPGQLLVETLFSGISRGTESTVFNGRVPPSEYERMRAPFQGGDFPGPVKYGYSNVGRIIAGDARREGQLVFCLYPHQSHYLIEAEHAHSLPIGVPPQRGVLAANMETALNALWDARPLPGDHVSIVGAGMLGCLLCSLLARSLALDVEVVDVDLGRRSAVESLGAAFAPPGSAQADRDIVFHTSGSSSGLASSLSLAKEGSRIVELSWFGDQLVEIPLGRDFHAKRLQLISSQVGTVSPNKVGWQYTDRLKLALSLLDDPRLDSLIGAPVAFDELPEHFRALTAKVSRRPGATPDSSAQRLCVQYADSP